MSAQNGRSFGSLGFYYFENEKIVFEFDGDVYQKMMEKSDTIAVEFADLNLFEVIKSGKSRKWQKEGWVLKKANGNRYKLAKKLKDFDASIQWNFRFITQKETLQQRESAYATIIPAEKFHLDNPNMPKVIVSDTGNAKFFLRGFTNAQKVILSGSFNEWDEESLKMEKTAEGWELRLQLKSGTYEYKFIVDGMWMEDPANPETRLNQYHTLNSVLRLAQTHHFFLNGRLNAKKVVICGSFNDWKTDEFFLQKAFKGWSIDLPLPAGKHSYKFIVDGEWITDPRNPRQENDGKGNINSILFIH